MPMLKEWESFYVIVGSSAGALIGLQFVVITLLADMPLGPGVQRTGAAMITPTIVHFGAVLLVSGIVSAPWHDVASATLLLGIVGAFGTVYSLITGKRLREQTLYKPELEDWL